MSNLIPMISCLHETLFANEVSQDSLSANGIGSFEVLIQLLTRQFGCLERSLRHCSDLVFQFARQLNKKN